MSQAVLLRKRDPEVMTDRLWKHKLSAQQQPKKEKQLLEEERTIKQKTSLYGAPAS